MPSESPPWQVLLLGGASGVGKSSVSYRLAQHYGVGLTEVDDFQRSRHVPGRLCWSVRSLPLTAWPDQCHIRPTRSRAVDASTAPVIHVSMLPIERNQNPALRGAQHTAEG